MAYPSFEHFLNIFRLPLLSFFGFANAMGTLSISGQEVEEEENKFFPFSIIGSFLGCRRFV